MHQLIQTAPRPRSFFCLESALMRSHPGAAVGLIAQSVNIVRDEDDDPILLSIHRVLAPTPVFNEFFRKWQTPQGCTLYLENGPVFYNVRLHSSPLLAGATGYTIAEHVELIAHRVGNWPTETL